MSGDVVVPPRMTLEVDIIRRLGRFTLNARFTSGSGVTALFGRSGSGKTAIVNVIAGLIRPDRGRVAIDGTTLVDTAMNVAVPPHRRRIGYVFQEDRLFPHLSVRRNLLYGRWFAKAGDGGEFDRLVLLLGLDTLLDRRPKNLSGGEKQRVAIGRALLRRPRLLLMDEPLASLDEARKQEVLPVIERLRDEEDIPIVYVSHSHAEVARLATAIVVLDQGRVLASGPAPEIMARLDLSPALDATDAGALIEAHVENHDKAFALTTLRSRAGLWRVPKIDVGAGSRVRLRVRARDVVLCRAPPQGTSALNVFAGVVSEVKAESASEAHVRVDCRGDVLTARLTRLSLAQLDIERGKEIYAMVKAVALDSSKLGRV